MDMIKDRIMQLYDDMMLLPKEERDEAIKSSAVTILEFAGYNAARSHGFRMANEFFNLSNDIEMRITELSERYQSPHKPSEILLLVKTGSTSSGPDV